MSYLGVPPFGQTVRTITESLATAGQTTFSPSGGYLPGYIDVFLNGSALGAADFTATNGSTVVLNVAAALNDEFKAIAYWPVSLIDTYRKAEADALLAARVGTTSSVSMRNRIINGDMRIDQRNAGASVAITTSGNYTVDRWSGNATQNGKYTVQQNAGSVTPPAGFINYLGATSSSAYSVGSGDVFWLAQGIEGLNISDLGWGAAGAQSITLSFWARSSLTGTFGGALRNAAGNRSYPFTYTISAANTWEQKSVTIAGDTSGTWLTTNGLGINLNFGLGAGATYSGTAGAWAAGNFVTATGATSVVGTNGATFYITGVQLEAGTVATPFERRDYGRELMMCQRYFWKSYTQDAAVGSANTNGRISMAGHNIAYENIALVSLPVVMRTSPTTTLYNPSTGAAGSYTADANTYTTYGITAFPNNIWVHSNTQVIGTSVFTSLHLAASAEL